MNRRILLGFLLLIAPPAAADCQPGALTGKVTFIRDGDTLELGALAIRLQGLAAPEGEELGGDEASNAMRALVLGKEITCELDVTAAMTAASRSAPSTAPTSPRSWCG